MANIQEEGYSLNEALQVRLTESGKCNFCRKELLILLTFGCSASTHCTLKGKLSVLQGVTAPTLLQPSMVLTALDTSAYVHTKRQRIHLEGFLKAPKLRETGHRTSGFLTNRFLLLSFSDFLPWGCCCQPGYICHINTSPEVGAEHSGSFTEWDIIHNPTLPGSGVAAYWSWVGVNHVLWLRLWMTWDSPASKELGATSPSMLYYYSCSQHRCSDWIPCLLKGMGGGVEREVWQDDVCNSPSTLDVDLPPQSEMVQIWEPLRHTARVVCLLWFLKVKSMFQRQ